MRSLLSLALAGALAVPLLAAGETAPAQTGADDVVVVAVIDGGFDPYHLDWSAREMPQHRDRDKSNDLPLDRAPDTWLPGFPSPNQFASYDQLDLTIPLDDTESRRALEAEDAEEWAKIQTSTSSDTHYYWAPGTKIIGMVDFDDHDVHAGGDSHGSGTSSVSVGNMFGSCPECVVVMIDYGGTTTAEDAINWAMEQPWIDVITNSYGLSTGVRDRIYSGSDTGRQRVASERGQTIAFSAGNGQANAFVAPNTTLYSSQEGPDWMITVGAVSPDGASYTGHGKPADIASVGTSYPSSYCASHSGCQGGFGGTSNATPVIAGMYAKALHQARLALAGPSRVQADGIIATGAPIACGDANPDCELGDGVLTAVELRNRLFGGAVHTAEGYFIGGAGLGVGSPRQGWEHEFLSEGHGSYFGRLNGDEDWMAEVDRIVGPMLGTQAPLTRPEGEVEWFTADSYCRQQLWGEWEHGYWKRGDDVPASDPAWPIRSSLYRECTPLPGPG